MRAALVPVREWAQAQAAGLPARWRREVLARWERAGQGGANWIEAQDKQARANAELRELCASLGGHARLLSLDATDADVCERAARFADECFTLATAPHLRDVAALREAMARRVRALGLEPPKAEGEKRPGRVIEDGPAVARMTCALWWRRQLRRAHARAVEAAAIRLGVVHAKRECYVSTQSLERRRQQRERNAAMLEATIARNELGQEFTLAELAAKGTANKAIRRAELMTRIAGFERIALELGHLGLFFTVTCPSRMHRWRAIVVGGRVVKVQENPRYDGTNPREANEYLGRVWARIRAALHRRGIRVYGFRIAEPQHDATPHWHFLVFHRPEDGAELQRLIAKYALQDSPDERGAAEHRCDFEPIDRERGSAAGYIAKYVAKNIDGYKVGEDLYGSPALESSARVEAWAATHRIRQFQQIGGPPVGVWRELRRVEAVPEGAPDYLLAAWAAVNKLAVIEGRENASVAWDRYCKAQGGVFCGRAALIQLAKAAQEGAGRYGDPLADRVIGVQTSTLELWRPEWMAHTGGISERRVQWVVESTRRQWEILGRRSGPSVELRPVARFDPWAPQEGASPEVLADALARAQAIACAEDFAFAQPPEAERPGNKQRQAARAARQLAALKARRESIAQRAQPAQPRTRVNNCTEGVKNADDDSRTGPHCAGACATVGLARGAGGGKDGVHQREPAASRASGPGGAAAVRLH